MISSAEYRERLLRMRPNVYIDGELVGRDDPRLFRRYQRHLPYLRPCPGAGV